MESKQATFSAESGKKKYAKPEFRRYGGLAQLTAAVAGNMGNANAAMGNSMTGCQ